MLDQHILQLRTIRYLTIGLKFLRNKGSFHAGELPSNYHNSKSQINIK